MNEIDNSNLQSQIISQVPQLVHELYRVVLQRDADPDGLSHYCSLIIEPHGIEKVLTSLLRSDEFAELSRINANGVSQVIQPVVFLHIQKTAGTSLQSMLQDKFGLSLFSEKNDTLGLSGNKFLSKYSVYAGHFNFDSLVHIPLKPFKVFTFVREPKERLISLYHFWRAYNPSAPGWSKDMEYANKFTIDAFFKHYLATKPFAIWNHMTWAVMGTQKWHEWRTQLNELTDPVAVELLIYEVLRPAIRARIAEFAFVGLQEDFDNSVEILCRILGWTPFDVVKKIHTLDLLTNEDPHCKKNSEKQLITNEIEALLDQFVQLDLIVYQEAKMLYSVRQKDC